MTKPAVTPTEIEQPSFLPSSQDRRHVSGPGLRAFLALADQWSLTEADRICLLGDPARSTFHQWKRKAALGQDIVLPLDTLMRISAALGVHKALTILFEVPRDALDWLQAPHGGRVFGGQSPLHLMLSGTQDGILQVRRYLDSWRGGLAGGPDAGIPPVTRGDLVFV